MKWKQYRVPIALVMGTVLLFVGLIFSLQVGTSNSALAVTNNLVDLGEIPIKGGIVEATFVVKNTGDEAVDIIGAETSCMCTEAEIILADGSSSPKIKMRGHGATSRIAMTINAGEEATVKAYFDPMAHGPNATGPIKRDVIVKTNSTEMPTVTASFQGVVVK